MTGTRMRQDRKALKLTQNGAARKAEPPMHPSTWSLIEAGRLLPGDDQLRRMAKVLGVPEDEAGSLLLPADDQDA